VEAALSAMGLLAEGTPLPAALPALDGALKALWADHGDAISNQYAGTGALKSGFTRTGKRTLGGLLDDGAKSVARYYLNNFADGRKQDALDLATGAFVPDAKPPPAARQASPAVPLLSIVLALALGARGALDGRPPADAARAMLAPAAYALSVLLLLLKNGKSLVNRPQLLPQLAALT
jgi:hypothetical protein